MGDSKTRRIAKNTILLYIRMLFLMIISLYTSRVILNALGVEDYGIYNVVGGMVTLLSVLTGSLSAAISRYITYEIGKGDREKLKKIFSTSLTTQILFSVIIIVIIETVGLWFLNNKMVIPSHRLTAATWCLHFSVVTFTIGLISVPYNAVIIAHEKMTAFAYISIIEGLGKLIIAWCIILNPIDRLIFYAAMMAVLSLFIRFIYAFYCKRNFDEVNGRFVYDPKLLKQMFSFAGWNFLGAASGRLMFQGLDLLSNVYFGVTVNAARGIATQIDTAIQNFVNNFTMAVNPQITKSYAVGDMKYMYSLMFRGARFSYLLILFFAIPIICDTHLILKLWLGEVPDHTVNFGRLAIIVSMINVLSNSMVTAMLATGEIKKYQLIVGGIGMFVLPIAWFLFYLGLPPEMAYVSVILIFIVQWLCRLNLLHGMIGLSILDYMKNVIWRVFLVTVISFPIPIFLCILLKEGILRLIIIVFISFFTTLLTSLTFGVTKGERLYLFEEIKLVVAKIKK